MASSDQNKDGHFQTTKENGIKEGGNILKEMEYRSVRAARMAYEQSAKYEKTLSRVTNCVPAATGTFSLIFIKPIFDKLFKPNIRSFFYAVPLAGIVTGLTYFKFAPEYVLPFYDKQQEKHNKAGAGWQELELRLRAYRATTLQSKVELKDMREEIDKFAEERKEVCLLARPSKEMHVKYEEKESVKKLIEGKEKIRSAVALYFGTD